eukprot:jgi/Ulvmu1/10041/UM059_0091.1
MANTLLEQTRQLHEDVERAERLVAKDLKRTMTKYKDKLQQDHRTKLFVDEVQEKARRLIRIYEDDEGVRKLEFERLSGQNQFSTFYERLKEVKEYYRRNPTAELTEAPDDDAAINTQVPLQFTGEEMYGRYLDLHEFFLVYINMTAKKQTTATGAEATAGDSQVDYITYVQEFAHFHRIPRRVKFQKAYVDYVEKLLRYLISFHERTQPLKSVVNLLGQVEDEFAEKWDGRELLGWEDCAEGEVPDDADLVIDVEAFDSPHELLELGADKLKSALSARHMKCGGTPQQRAERLFQCRGRQLQELPANLFTKGAAPAAALNEAARNKRIQAAKHTANIEAKVLAVVDSLGAVIEDTQAWVEKKLAQNYDELKQDIEREDFDVGPEDSDEEDEYVYNPLKLPLGPDGKPIPYWLYKLHGLNQEYKCDICGGDIFRGRREYERHFRESKHVQAMAALGITSSKAFFEVTKVDEAVALWNNLQKRNTGNWNPDLQEEFEDEDGNVYNRRTYIDLQRQGLV